MLLVQGPCLENTGLGIFFHVLSPPKIWPWKINRKAWGSVHILSLLVKVVAVAVESGIMFWLQIRWRIQPTTYFQGGIGWRKHSHGHLLAHWLLCMQKWTHASFCLYPRLGIQTLLAWWDMFSPLQTNSVNNSNALKIKDKNINVVLHFGKKMFVVKK